MSSHLTDEGVVTPTMSIVPFSVLQHFYTVLMFSTIWLPRQPVAEGHWEVGIFPFELAFLFLVIESTNHNYKCWLAHMNLENKRFFVSDLFFLFCISMNIKVFVLWFITFFNVFDTLYVQPLLKCYKIGRIAYVLLKEKQVTCLL